MRAFPTVVAGGFWLAAADVNGDHQPNLRQVRGRADGASKERFERLIEQGLMTPAGLVKIEAAKRDGSWSAYDAIEAPTVPAELQEALRANPTAEGHFAAFGSSATKQLLWWIASAKRPETRTKRIAQLVTAAEENRNPIAYSRPRTP